MKILFLTHRLPYAPNRGDRLRAYHFLRILSAEHQIHVLSLVHDTDEESHAGDLVLENLAETVATARVPRLTNLVRSIGALPSERPLTHLLLDSPEMHQKVARFLAGGTPDVVLALCSGMARFALEPALSAYPLVLDLIDVDSQKWRELAQRSSGPKGWIYAREARTLARFEARAAQHAVSTLVVNPRESRLLAEIAPGARIDVVENGIDFSSLRPVDAPSDRRTVVFCGVMNYGPNEEGAIWLAREVWPVVLRHWQDARLILLGSNPTTAVRRLAGRDRSIEVTGTVDDVKPYLWRSAVSAAPLFLARGIQNKVLEAVAAGLPAVITSVVADGLPRDVMPGCVVADSAAGFAECLVRLLGVSPAERRAIASRADLTALGWNARRNQLVEILGAAATRRSSSER